MKLGIFIKKGEKDDLANVKMTKQEIEEDRLDKDNEIEEENPYQNMKNNIDRNGTMVSTQYCH